LAYSSSSIWMKTISDRGHGMVGGINGAGAGARASGHAAAGGRMEPVILGLLATYHRPRHLG
jgi:hypothetical protein